MILSSYFSPQSSKSENSVKKKTMNLTELAGNAEKAIRNIFETI